MTTMMYRDVPILATIVGRAVCRFEHFTPQDVGNTIWALAKLLIFHGPFFQAAASIGESRLRDFPPQNLTNIVWSFTAVMFEEKRFMQQAATAAL